MTLAGFFSETAEFGKNPLLFRRDYVKMRKITGHQRLIPENSERTSV